MTDEDEEFQALKEKIAKKCRLIQKHKEELNKLYGACTHKETKLREYYFEGSYFDKAHTEITRTCEVCGKNLGTETKEHSWYG